MRGLEIGFTFPGIGNKFGFFHTHAGVVEIAADGHVERVTARIGTIIILGDSEGHTVPVWIYPVSCSANNHDFNFAVAGDEMVVLPADGVLRRMKSGITCWDGYGREGAGHPDVCFVHVETGTP